ncbi:MAG: ABC transporter permease, partial [Gemmatimonadaceae bacterium]
MTDSLATLRGDSEQLTVCVVAHTHWDREWYHSAARFRQQLVALVDALFTMPESDAFPFLLDGQAVVLEDYLAVRPEMADRVGSALRAGKIEAGPWYVLADGLIPSGEALVRNLLAGRRVLRRFGAAAPSVAYCPDTFGHSAAIPTIAHGFGFQLAIVWRGFGGARWPKGDVVRWHSANGASVLTYHLPPDGYETGSALPTEPSAVAKRWASFRELMAKRSTTGVVLLPNGADHHALQPDIRAAFEALHATAKPDVVVRESLGGFAKRVVDAAASHNDPLPAIEGDPTKALFEPNTVVLSASAAKKYFNSTKAVGETIEIKRGDATIPFKVTAVVQDVPKESHFNFDI